ncbi:outer membrane protein assembly factor BamD [Hanstruepera marina]|uniref:outer membrane protein assembly factor BamD n=1 Tax=Hanstruepera marina TaxID=2873265 RepID=UPI001CA77BFE|nr:outer membrane protein assembly factor BamD [Hanstruepera marina]
MRKFLYIILTCTFLSSCSEYQKALKTTDIGTKFKEGEKQYDAGKFEKANKLFAAIVPSYRGKPQAEKLMYLYSKTFYEMEEWYLASYQFERFVGAYPNSEKLEEASFLGAKSAYNLAPVYTKEQHETRDALDKLQAFINAYPQSEYLPEANQLVKELDFKLERKAFEIAKQYNAIAGYTGDYTAPIKAMEDFIFNFPASKYREEAFFIKFDSAYNLAINSVLYKRQERLEEAITHYLTFKKSYSGSEYMEEANQMYEEIQSELQNYTTKS